VGPLLACGDVDVNAKDDDSRASLSPAVRDGYYVVALLLLARGAREVGTHLVFCVTFQFQSHHLVAGPIHHHWSPHEFAMMDPAMLEYWPSRTQSHLTHVVVIVNKLCKGERVHQRESWSTV
jgi:hypothetical protein